MASKRIKNNSFLAGITPAPAGGFSSNLSESSSSASSPLLTESYTSVSAYVPEVLMSEGPYAHLLPKLYSPPTTPRMENPVVVNKRSER